MKWPKEHAIIFNLNPEVKTTMCDARRLIARLDRLVDLLLIFAEEHLAWLCARTYATSAVGLV